MSTLVGTAFRKVLEQRTKTNHSRVIFALDIANTLSPDATPAQRQQLINQACQLARTIAPYIAAIKLNYPLVLATGLEVAHHLKTTVPNVPLIADFKVADIDNTNAWIARHTFTANFDAIIVHAFIGTDAIQAVLNEAYNHGDRGVILVVDMSHPGGLEFIHPQAQHLTQLAITLGVTGVIAPGTRPAHVKQIRSWLGPDPLIFTPGVGAQGGKPGSAIAAGADYEIIGRAIYQAANPVTAAQSFAKATYRKTLRKPKPDLAQEEIAIAKTVAFILHKTGAVQFGSFTLASGQTSPYYIDLRLVPSHPAAFAQLIDLETKYLAVHSDIQFDRIAGVPTAGLSFATLLSQRLGKPLLYVRGTAKNYGRRRRVEGQLQSGDQVLVVDDLITDGRSKLDIVQALRTEGANVTDVLVVIDREQGGTAGLQKKQVTLRALASITDIVHTLTQQGHLSKQKAQEIKNYIAKQRSSL